MTSLPTVIFAIIFAVLILHGNVECKHKNKEKRDIFITIHTDNVLGWMCNNVPYMSSWSACPTTTTTTKSSTTASFTTSTSIKPSTSESATASTASKSSVAVTATAATASQSSTAATYTTSMLKSQSSSSVAYTTSTFYTSTSATTKSSTTASPTNLERAHWCRFSNGTYIPLGYTFMYAACTICQCTQSHEIRCAVLQCMPTYCIDGSTPSNRTTGQCCAQCAYEAPAATCVYNGVTFPHGTIVKSTSDYVQCWCEFGSIECRKYGGYIFSSLDFWGNGTAVYVIVIIICILVIVGSLLCCGCTLFYYYYYQNNQQAVQQAYDEYWNNAGWQPMSEDGQAATDANAEQKKAEDAEQSQHQYPTGNSEDYIPPPYALHNGSYVHDETQKHS